MQINISGHHLDITDALRAYVGERPGDSLSGTENP